ncbi:ABC transporter ATP-binding protein [Sporosarcina oncorhynchi]|uniref:ABC transporter ATP-binding protein n=1 Tax=Sporosarcina oncorhynchi TaxID=3056444 RepID=A0ABZ0L5G0_9BACL|nr:ABC transporter ATP-binding protein [Sporosarcina sp. T2O-4]WOV87781.1 ABC transporter ATP-binding protein [Sporosarcina sp. T2O-4]
MIVQVKGLKKKYKKDWVLKGIDITIDEPQIIALVGPNGSGKTTLLNCMMNLLTFNEGSVEILGKPNSDPSLFNEISYLQDNRILYGNLTAYDHLKFICRVQKIPFDRIQEVAERVGMTGYMKRRVRSFSLGMKQHLLLAMAILNKPKLLIMDEPLNGLDPTSAINVRTILLELYNEGTTIIISSHVLDEIDRLTNTIYFMKDGALLKESLEKLTVTNYELTVSEPEKAKEILDESGLPVTMNELGHLNFKETDVPLQTIIDVLYRNDVVIAYIDNHKAGAEKRYRELFEERSPV